jgi:uncharacterized protein
MTRERHVKEQLALLITLQTLDRKRQEQRENLERLPEKIAAAEEPLKEAKEASISTQDELDILSKDRREKELSLKVIEEKIRKLKMRLTDLKTNKEYHAHLQEIASVNKEKENLEDLLLNAMEESDQLNKALSENEVTLKEEEAAFLVHQTSLETEIKALIDAEKKLEAEWEGVAKALPPDLLDTYKRISAKRKGMAVVVVNGKTCTGCNFSLPPQLIAEVKKREKIHTCNYCNRMLYTAELPPTISESSRTS